MLYLWEGKMVRAVMAGGRKKWLMGRDKLAQENDELNFPCQFFMYLVEWVRVYSLLKNAQLQSPPYSLYRRR
jgi:hypothetical protein